jgi:hypothetical protein
VTIELGDIEDQLFAQLRLTTVQRLRAAVRGDDGLGLLLVRQRGACLAALRAHLSGPASSMQRAA